jgi:predicted transcriptional regulator
MRNEEEIKGVMLALHGGYWKKMLSGEKKYEFRRRLWNVQTDRVFIYVTAPMSMVVGGFRCRGKWITSPENAWTTANGHAGLKQCEFYDYLDGTDRVGVISVGDVRAFKEPLSVTAFGLTKGPQSISYVRVVPQLVYA